MGELAIGRRGVLGIAAESVRGTADAPSYYIPFTSLGFENKVEKKERNGAFGQIQDSIAANVLKKYAEGDFEADLDDKAIGLILAGFFGALPSTSGSTNYTHEYVIANTNVHQSLTLTTQDPNVSTSYPLAMLDSLEITVEPEDYCKYKCSFRSKDGTDNVAPVTPSFASEGNIFNHSQVSVKIAANEAALGAATALNIVGLTLTGEKNVKDFNDLGSLETGEITNTNITFEGQIKLGYTDKTFRDYLRSDDTKAVQITFSVGANNSLVFILPQVSFMNWETDKSLDDIVVQTLDFKALWSSSANAVKATLKNQEDYALAEES